MSPHALEGGAVANSTTSETEGAGLELHVVGLDRPRPEDEHLAPSGVDDRERVVPGGCERVKRRDPCGRDVERKREPSRYRQANPGAGEAAGSGSNDEGIDVDGLGVGVTQERVDILEERACDGGTLPQDIPIPQKGTGRDVGCRVERAIKSRLSGGSCTGTAG